MVGERGRARVVVGGRLFVIPVVNTERIEWFVSLISDRVSTRGETSEDVIVPLLTGLVCRLASTYTREAPLWVLLIISHLHVLLGCLDIRHRIGELNPLQFCRLGPSRNS